MSAGFEQQKEHPTNHLYRLKSERGLKLAIYILGLLYVEMYLKREVKNFEKRDSSQLRRVGRAVQSEEGCFHGRSHRKTS